jgi:hypothetical protein
MYRQILSSLKIHVTLLKTRKIGKKQREKRKGKQKPNLKKPTPLTGCGFTFPITSAVVIRKIQFY